MPLSKLPAIEFELCAESLEACLAARDGGAHRIELCSALSEGGLTPSHGLVIKAVQSCNLPVHPILRPRGGDFVYSDEEYEVMVVDLLHMRELGASGIAVGLLHLNRRIDVERTSQLVSMAHPLEVTFHRAFDCVSDLSLALEDVIATGCRRLLTSGGKSNVREGSESLRDLIAQAGDRIAVMAGGGLRHDNAAEVARVSHASVFHGSLRRKKNSPLACVPGEQNCSSYAVHEEDVRAMIAELDAAWRDRTMQA